MSTFRKPMLAATLNQVEDLRFPVLASPKMDGIRCLIQDGHCFSRSGKPIPNAATRRFLEAFNLEGCDGELMVHGLPFNKVSSTFMNGSTALPAKWYYAVFDMLPEYAGEPYTARLARLTALHQQLPAEARERVVLTVQVELSSVADLEVFEAECLRLGFEGVMLRRASTGYKHGRCTLQDARLVKMKRFTDGEATIVGFQQLVTEAGVLRNLLGAFVVQDRVTGVQFEIGTGYSLREKEVFWQKRATMLGQVVKYKHFEHGAKNKPRFPVYLGVRAAEDMSD